MAPRKGKTVAVIGSGSDPHSHLSNPLGRWLAQNGHHLINGGGPGVMAETAKAFCEVEIRKGLVVGVIPSIHPCGTPEQRAAYGAPPGYPNACTELVIRTHLHLSGSLGKDPASRNHLIVLSADHVVALPGGEGTRSEIQLALDYNKPLVLVSPQGEWKEFSGQASVVASVEAAVREIG